MTHTLDKMNLARIRQFCFLRFAFEKSSKKQQKKSFFQRKKLHFFENHELGSLARTYGTHLKCKKIFTSNLSTFSELISLYTPFEKSVCLKSIITYLDLLKQALREKQKNIFFHLLYHITSWKKCPSRVQYDEILTQSRAFYMETIICITDLRT